MNVVSNWQFTVSGLLFTVIVARTDVPSELNTDNRKP